MDQDIFKSKFESRIEIRIFLHIIYHQNTTSYGLNSHIIASPGFSGIIAVELNLSSQYFPSEFGGWGWMGGLNAMWIMIVEG